MDTFVPKGNISGPILPEFVLKLSITAGAKLMYSLLCWHAYDKDYCWPSYANLAKRMGCSINSIKNYFNELVNAKLVVVQKESYRSSKYYLLKPSEEIQKSGKCENDPQNIARQHDAHLSNFDDNPSNFGVDEPNFGYLNKDIKKIQETPPPAYSQENCDERPKNENRMGVGDSLSDFEKVYAAYPRKEAKGLARAAWQTLARSKFMPLLSVILESIERFKNSANWQRENGRFIPQLSNFLKGERWNDPIPDEEIKQTAICEESKKIRDSMKQAEERRRLEYENEKLKHQPAFDAFAAKFNGSFHRPMVFGKWLSMHSKHCAPLASDVPDNNTLGIMEFLTEFERKSKVALYNENHQEILSDDSSHSDEPHKDLPREMNIRPHSAKESKQPPAVKSGIGMNFSHNSSIHKFMLRNNGNLENRPRGKIQSSRDILFMAMPQANSSALQAATC